MAQQDAKGLSAAVGQLAALRRLDLRGNALASLPAELALCTQLTALELGDNCFSALPPAVANLMAVRHLGLERNQVCASACLMCVWGGGVRQRWGGGR